MVKPLWIKIVNKNTPSRKQRSLLGLDALENNAGEMHP